MKKIYVFIEGGVVQSVCSDEKDVEVIIIDKDIDDENEVEEMDKIEKKRNKELKAKVIFCNY